MMSPQNRIFFPLTKIHSRYVPGYDQAAGRFAAECKFFLIGFIRIVEFRKLDDGNSKQLAEYKPSMGWAAPLGLHVLFRKRMVLGHYLARSCPNAVSQFSMWKVFAILPSLMV